MTETRRPCSRKCGMRRVSSVVLPAPLHPARPITLIYFSERPAEPAMFCPKGCFISANGECHAGHQMMMKIDEAPTPAIPGVLLAGGLARRMGGGDKPM